MLTCKECRRNLYPEDPSIPTGKYGHSSCDYFCDKPVYYRELETQSPPEQIIVHRHSSMSAQENDILQQTARRTVYLEKKLNELLTERKSKNELPF